MERHNNAATDDTYYVRDASGNVMSVYTYTDSLRLTEQHLYGSSRLGVIKPILNLERAVPSSVSIPILNGSGIVGTFTRGNKLFELSIHLISTLVTISDKKIAVDANTDSIIDYYNADIITANDYYPGGMQMPGRKFSSGNQYRFGFGGQEKTDEISGAGNHYTAPFWEYDPRLGRRWNVDPATAKHPNESPYLTYHNNPIFFTDPLGDDPPEGFKKVAGKGGDVFVPQSTTTTNYSSDGGTYCSGDLQSFTIGSKTFSAQYGSDGSFSGYFNGTTQYQNPDITIASGGFTGTDLANMKVTFNVTNVPADGLQMVQPLVYSGLTASAQASNSSMSFNSDGLITGQYYFSNGTVKMAGEVDGAKGSFFSFQNGGAAANSAGPYYNSPAELASASYANMTWNGTSGSITAFDGVSARVEQKVMTFRTIIVAVNYMGTGKDVALGTYEWGWDNYGTTPIHGATPSLKGNTPTTRDMQIIQHYYPTYDFFK